MTRYLVSTAAAAVLGIAAFAPPASADPDVGFSFSLGDRGHRHYDRDYYYEPGVRVYSGRSSYRDCDTKRVVKWRNGKKIVRTVRDCD